MDSFIPSITHDEKKIKRNKVLSICKDTQLEFNLKDEDLDLTSAKKGDQDFIVKNKMISSHF